MLIMNIQIVRIAFENEKKFITNTIRDYVRQSYNN